MNRKNRVLIFVIVFLLISIFAVSYAYFEVTKTSELNSASSKCFSIEFQGSGQISLSGAIPISDDTGKGMNEKYRFTVRNTCDMRVAYDVNLEIMNDSSVGFENYVKAYLVTDPSSGTVTPAILGSYNPTDAKITTGTPKASVAYKLKSGVLEPRNSANDSVTYDLRLWVDYATEPNVGNNKTLNSRVTVVANAIK